MTVSIRPAQPEDGSTLFALIQALAEYEREPDAVHVDAETLSSQLAQAHPPFACLLAEWKGDVVGFVLFFPTYSTWLGQPGMWLEDFFVLPHARRQGVGRALFAALGRVCIERNYGRLDFTVLDWNELAHTFYRSIGAEPMSDWTTWRLKGNSLAKIAGTPDLTA